MYLVVGLGNPERRYERTKHNVGFLVIDRLADRVRASVTRKELGALVERAPVAGLPAVLAKPQSYMNLSGQPVASLRGFYKVPVEAIVVVHDDLDIPFGDVRVKLGGGHGGHNGLRDIQARLGGNNFVRVRVGIGRPPAGWDVAEYVLSKWSAAEEVGLDQLVNIAADAVESVLTLGVKQAMNTVNAPAVPAKILASSQVLTPARFPPASSGVGSALRGSPTLFAARTRSAVSVTIGSAIAALCAAGQWATSSRGRVAPLALLELA